jgi:hypothetical protein
MPIPAKILDRVQSLYDRGLHLQAYQTAIAHAPLAEWQSTRARILAGRIALQVGGQRRLSGTLPRRGFFMQSAIEPI